MRLLVTGAAGMLGQDVVSAAARAGHDVVALSRRALDVTDADAVRRAVDDAAPDAVVNCAAWTDVDGAETDEGAATAVNGDGAGNVAAGGTYVVHVSTDYVFAGDADQPYVESDAVGPRSAYGRSKLAGEEAVRAKASRHAIVRTSWLFGPGGPNFVDTMRRLAEERDELTVVDDQTGCPTYTGHLATALVEVAERGLTGTLHVAGGGQATRFDLAAAIGLSADLRRGTTAGLNRPAPRPSFSVIRSERSDAPTLPDWHAGLEAHLS